ncbi:MAG TPA: GntR family transcriptional regulator [Variovorax sp.]
MKTAPPLAPAPFVPAQGTSLHRQLFLVLRDQINQGQFPEGALPKEEALGERFGVSRITVRRALADLAAQGLVERRHGRGTFVAANLPLARRMPSLSVLDSLRKTAQETEVRVLEVSQAVAPPDVASLLLLAPGAMAVHALRLRSHPGGAPALLTDVWVPADIGQRATAAALKKKALYEILMAQGVEFGRVVQEISAVVAEPVRAGLLQTEVGGPMLRLVRLMHDLNERPVLHLTAYMPAERSRILMEFPGADVNTLNAGQIVHDTP